MSIPYSYINELKKAIGVGNKTVLDVGCGSNSPLRLIAKNHWSVGVDAHKPNLIISKKKGFHDAYLNMSFSELGCFDTCSFDCVVALDIIEHLEKNKGMTLLDNLERISRKRTIIFTPNGFVSQGEYENNPWQVHRSGWTVEEMRHRGYEIIGINGLRCLRGEKAAPKIKPKLMGEFVSIMTQFFAVNRPEYAFSLLCIKTKEP